MNTGKPANIINHIAFVLDASTSMRHLADAVVRAVDAQVAHLAQRSREMGQETRITVYTFYSMPKSHLRGSDGNDEIFIVCLIWDKDVLRMDSIKGLYRPNGNTPMIDATLKGIEDLNLTPQIYGDHSFLLFTVTDGQNNQHNHLADTLRRRIEGLPENWTVAAMVPDVVAVSEAKRFGFPANNIQIWDATSVKGVSEMAETWRTTTDAYMLARTQGVRGSRNLFRLNADAIASDALEQALTSLHPGQYRILEVTDKEDIAGFVERKLGRPYRKGEAFYQLTKPETVQAQKDIAILREQPRRLFVGAQARRLLGLPDHEVRVDPVSKPGYKVFVQSTSVNRNLMPDTQLLILS